MASNNNLTTADIKAMGEVEARKFVSAARTAVKNAVKADRNATNRAAYATWHAEHTLGIIGQNSRGNDGYLNDEAWAASFDKVKSITGAWRTLGRVLVDLGLDPEGETYMRLRNSNIYQTADCKKVINDEATTPGNVEDRLIAHMEGKVDKFGKRLPPNRGTGSDTETEAQRKARKLDGEIGEFVEKVGQDKTVVAQALTLISALDKTVANADQDDWTETIEKALTALIEGRNKAYADAVKIEKKSA